MKFLGLLLVVPTAISWLGGKEFLGAAALIVLEGIYLAGLVLLIWKPTDGANRYGPDPRLDPEESEFATE